MTQDLSTVYCQTVTAIISVLNKSQVAPSEMEPILVHSFPNLSLAICE